MLSFCSAIFSLFLMHKVAAEAPVFTLAAPETARKKGERELRLLFMDTCQRYRTTLLGTLCQPGFSLNPAKGERRANPSVPQPCVQFKIKVSTSKEKGGDNGYWGKQQLA